MSRRSLEDWLRASVEARIRGDREACLSYVHPDWEFHTSGVLSVRGRDGIETERDRAYVVSGRDGIPMRTDNFATWAAALESVGLRE